MNRSLPYPHNKDSQNPNRGTKRSRPPNDRGESSSASIQAECNVDQDLPQNDDVDVPLSKRINRLNIDYSSSNR